jgi:hypothetical protein
MPNLGKVAFAGLLVVGAAWSAQGQDKEARAVIDKAIKAHGGADNINKLPASHLKAKGSMEAMGMNLNFNLEIHSQEPDKVRSVVELDISGKQFIVINVFDGKKAWESIGGQTKEVKDAKKLEKHKTDIYVQRITSLAPLAGKEFELSLVGETKVKDDDTVGVRVTSKGKPDVSLYFNKKTGLLAKAEHRTIEPFNMNEVNQEEYYSDYKQVDGVKLPHRLVIEHDGKRFMELDITEMKRLEKIADAMFGPP